MRDEQERLARALEWVARLPLCGDRELAGLLGVDERDARRLAGALAARGWVETVPALSPELDARRLAILRAGASPALAAACGRDPASLAGAAPVRPRDLARRIAALETCVSVNRLLADLAEGLASSGVARLADARSLPLALAPARRWWLPGVEGYGCLRSGPLHAPFLVAWDRAAAPDAHRRRKALGPGSRRAPAPAGGGDGRACRPSSWSVPPTARPGCGRRRSRGGTGRASGRLDVLLTTREEMDAAGATEARWWRPGRAAAELVEQLGWGAAPEVDAVRIAAALDECAPPPRRGGTPDAGRALARRARPGPAWQRLADLALQTTAAEKTLTEWVARHPLLSGPELSALTGEPQGGRAPPGAARGRGRDRRRPYAARRERDPCREGDALEPRYLLTEPGLRSIAARAGVPPAAFARHGGVTFIPARQTSGRPVVRHREHALGVNRVAAGIARGARAAGWLLAEWRNEAESTHRFRGEDGRASWIRPDASGVLARGAERRPFLLEYDRGTLDSGDYRPKLEGYRRYYAAREWEDRFPSQPALLFVCSDHRAEARVGRAVAGWTGQARVLVTTEGRAADGGLRRYLMDAEGNGDP